MTKDPLEATIQRIPQCKISEETSYADYLEELERLVATGCKVHLSDKWKVMSDCNMQPFKVVERATGGAGVTKFYEIEVHCPTLSRKIAEAEGQSRYWIELPGFVPQRFHAVQGAVNFCVKALEDLGYDPEPRRVGMWKDTSEFVPLTEHLPDPFDLMDSIVFISKNHKKFPMPLLEKVGQFSDFLCSFDEDSVEEIAGRILNSAINLFRDRGGHAFYEKMKFDRSVLEELHTIGRLHERLIWKVKYEAAAAKGFKVEADQVKRDKGSGAASSRPCQRRRISLLETMEAILEDNPDFRGLGLKVLSTLALRRCQERDPKLWSQGAGQIRQYLADLGTDPAYRARVKALDC